MKWVSKAICVMAFTSIATAQEPSSFPQPLVRHYKEGEAFTYVMKGSNKGYSGTQRYEVKATGLVQKNKEGQFIESFAWSNLVRNGSPIQLPESSIQFRQVLSRAPGMIPSVPDISRAPELVGPICDLLTFYADLFMASMGNLTKPGAHVYFPLGIVTSFASGSQMLIAEDAVDFDITLKEVDPKSRVATLNVKHLPPKDIRVKLPAPWMKVPVLDTPNNWVQVIKDQDGTYIAEMGKETFDCMIRLDLTDGKILSAVMDNPVDVVRRICKDAELTQAGEPINYQVRRQIELQFVAPAPVEPAK